MKETSYRKFSLNMHLKKIELGMPSMCHFELTYKCNFSCQYCYVSCNNEQRFVKHELSTGQVKLLLDKVYETGALWLCFTGGDPLMRKDFFEIYGYAKRKGFIISILTNASLLDEDKISYFKKFPPFAFEITLNSVRKETFERISGAKGSFSKAMRAVKLLAKNKINFFLKAVVIKDNASELFEVKKFAQSLGVDFRVSTQIFPRINNDRTPCSLRVSPKGIIELDKKLNLGMEVPVLCFGEKALTDVPSEAISIFPCGGGTRDQVCINPYGEMFFCICFREVARDILNNRSIESCFEEFARIRQKGYQTQSRCRYCDLKEFCFNCPGKAYLETQDMEAPVDWFCELTHLCCDKAKSLARV